MTEKLEYALRAIKSCPNCNGIGNLYWSNGEDYDTEICECNPYGLVLDGDDVVWDNGLLSEPELAIFATREAD